MPSTTDIVAAASTRKQVRSLPGFDFLVVKKFKALCLLCESVFCSLFFVVLYP